MTKMDPKNDSQTNQQRYRVSAVIPYKYIKSTFFGMKLRDDYMIFWITDRLIIHFFFYFQAGLIISHGLFYYPNSVHN